MQREPLAGILFDGISRQKADENVLNCIKYLCNHFFQIFGFEVRLCLVFIGNNFTFTNKDLIWKMNVLDAQNQHHNVVEVNLCVLMNSYSSLEALSEHLRRQIS